MTTLLGPSSAAAFAALLGASSSSISDVAALLGSGRMSFLMADVDVQQLGSVSAVGAQDLSSSGCFLSEGIEEGGVQSVAVELLDGLFE